MKADVARIKESNFNSIKVRLKPYAGKGIGYGDTFQFHKGTIKTRGRFASCVLKSSISIP